MTTNPAHGSNLRGIFYMLVAGMAFVANDSLIKLTMSELPALEILVLRGIFGSLWCSLGLLMLGFGKDILKAFHPWVVARALFEVVAILAFVTALSRMAIGDVTAIYQTSPLLVTAGAAIFWHEKVRPLQYTLIGLALLGALLVAQPGSSTASIYAVFPFVTALAASGRDLISRRINQDIPGLVVAFSTIVIVLVASAILHLATETWVPPSNFSLASMLAAGLFLLMGHTFVFLAYRHGAAGAVAPFGYAVTAWAVLAGYLLFSDIPNSLSLIGMALIVCSGIAAIIYEQNRSKA